MLACTSAQALEQMVIWVLLIRKSMFLSGAELVQRERKLGCHVFPNSVSQNPFVFKSLLW